MFCRTSSLAYELVLQLIFAILLIFTPAINYAQEFPNKPVTLVVAFPAGGGTDIVARKLANALSRYWGQNVIVDNKGGAGGVIGTTQAAHASPSGYTILLATMGNLAINPHLYDMSIDTIKDLSPISNVVGVNFVLVCNPKLGVNSVQELLTKARANPKGINYSSSGIGGAPHLAVELMGYQTGTQFTHIVYKGSGPSITDLLGGQVDFTMDSLVQVLPYIESGKLKALAVLGGQRSPLLPNVPTMKEAGLSTYEFVNWFALVAPAGTPDKIIQKIHNDLEQVMQSSELRQDFNKMGADVILNTPIELGRQIKMDYEKWKQVVEVTHLKK